MGLKPHEFLSASEAMRFFGTPAELTRHIDAAAFAGDTLLLDIPGGVQLYYTPSSPNGPFKLTATCGYALDRVMNLVHSGRSPLLHQMTVREFFSHVGLGGENNQWILKLYDKQYPGELPHVRFIPELLTLELMVA